MSLNKTIYVYTDGSSLGNPGPGGWGVYVEADGTSHCRAGGDADTTNQRMELMAAIKALELFPDAQQAIIHTDSQYVLKGITEWIHGWKRKGWVNANGRPVANRDLWEQLDECRQDRDVEWVKVKAHIGNPGNEKADALAKLAANDVLDGNFERSFDLVANN